MPRNTASTECNPQNLADRIEDLLPQTQCTKCGYAACRPYAEAVAEGQANYNQCPPGGQEGVARLAQLLGKPVVSLNPENGLERVRPVAVIARGIEAQRCCMQSALAGTTYVAAGNSGLHARCQRIAGAAGRRAAQML